MGTRYTNKDYVSRDNPEKKREFREREKKKTAVGRTRKTASRFCLSGVMVKYQTNPGGAANSRATTKLAETTRSATVVRARNPRW